jgi:hypothetical protein
MASYAIPVLQSVADLAVPAPIETPPVEGAPVLRAPLGKTSLCRLGGNGLVIGGRMLFSGQQPVQRKIELRTKLEQLPYFWHGPAGFPLGNGSFGDAAQLA